MSQQRRFSLHFQPNFAIAAICIAPLLLVFLNLTFSNRALNLPALITQAWTGLVILLGIAYSSGMHRWESLKPHNLFRQFEAFRAQHAWFLWVIVLVWSLAWLVVWVTLPAGHLLKLLLPPVFFTLAFISIGSVDSHAKLLRKVLLVGFVGLVSTFVWNLATHTFILDRFVSDFTGPLDVSGRHYQYVQVLHDWRGVQLWGEVGNLRTGFRYDVPGLELLQFIRAYGALPGALLCAAMIVGWVALWRWLRAVKATESFSAEKKRLGLGLLAMLGVALILYVLFNFGISRLSFGVGVLELSRANFASKLPWLMIVVALGWLMFQAYRVGGTKEEASSGKSKLISATGYGLLFCLTAFVLLLWSEYRRHSHHAELAASRGGLSGYSTREVIRNAEGKAIAENKLAYDVWVTPYEFWGPSLQNPKQAEQANINSTSLNDTQREARLLEALTAWPKTQAIVKFRLAEWRKSKDDQSILAWAVAPEIAEKLKAQNIQGITVKPRTTRHYSDGALYANTLGFTGLSDPKYSLEGMELAANRHLHTFSDHLDAKDRDGITTTLVANIQQAARDTLQAGVKAHGASGGAIVVVDVEKNEIAAMVSAPDFDPNDMSSYRNPYQPDRILNRAINKDFPIGHLISPLVVAHQLESGQTTLNTKVALGDGSLKVGGVVVKDAYRHDVLSVEEIIAKSSNVGLAKLMMQMPLPELERIHDALGFSQPLRIYGLTGGLASETAPFSKWTPEMQAMPGTWIDANLMQVLRAYMPIANGGYLATPYITKTSLKANTPQVMKSATAAAIRQAMVQVVSITGTSPKAQIMGVEVAGKTSTMIGWNKSSAPVSKDSLRDTAVFVGMLPAAKPKWLVGVFLEFPSGKIKFAGDTSAPMFANLADKSLILPSDRVLSPVTISSDKDKSVEIK